MHASPQTKKQTKPPKTYQWLWVVFLFPRFEQAYGVLSTILYSFFILL